MTLLSICIPLFGDRPDLRPALSQMLQSPETGFEIVIADFRIETGHKQGPAMGEASDPRLRLVTPDTAPGEPDQCWNWMISQAKGEWITVIGEADYADPEICAVIRATLKRVPDADALAWGQARFTPPGLRNGREIARIPTGSRLLLPDQTQMMRQVFYWSHTPDQPDCQVGIWHGAVRRALLDRIRDGFSGRFVEQRDPETDNRCKVVMLAGRMAMWERPLSVRSSLPDNATDLAAPEASVEGFPFTGLEGPVAQLARGVEAFKRRYGIELEGWEDGFVAACVRDCEAAVSGEVFHRRKDAYARAIGAWRGKRALKAFRPVFKHKPGMPRFKGIRNGLLHFDMAMEGCEDAAYFYRLLNAMSFPVSLLDEKLA